MVGQITDIDNIAYLDVVGGVVKQIRRWKTAPDTAHNRAIRPASSLYKIGDKNVPQYIDIEEPLTITLTYIQADYSGFEYINPNDYTTLIDYITALKNNYYTI